MVKNTKEYLVLVSDVVAKHITIKAKSEKEALFTAGAGDWFDSQVEKEDVVDRQAEEILEVKENNEWVKGYKKWKEENESAK